MTTSPLISAAAFLKRREPWLKDSPRTQLLAYLGWYWRDGRMGIVRDGPRILAVALARCINSPEQARLLSYEHHEDGKIVWVDHIASVHPWGVPLLLRQAMQRFGPREAFGGDVFKRAGELRMLPWRAVEKLTAQLDQHGITETARAACCT